MTAPRDWEVSAEPYRFAPSHTVIRHLVIRLAHLQILWPEFWGPPICVKEPGVRLPRLWSCWGLVVAWDKAFTPAWQAAEPTDPYVGRYKPVAARCHN